MSSSRRIPSVFVGGPISEPAFIERRLVLHFPGYEPLTAQDHYERMLRECARFRNVWEVEQEIGPLGDQDGVSVTEVTTNGGEWSTHTKMVFLEWSSFVPRPDKNDFWRCILACTPRYLAHFKTPVPWRYFGANWRYALYFLWPALLTLAMVVLALLAGLLIIALTGWPAWTLWLIFPVFFVPLFSWLGRRWHLHMLLDVNDYTHSLGLREEPVSNERLATFNKAVKAELEKTDAAEITVTFHSTGSVFAVACLANVLRENPNILKGRSLKLAFAGLGSNLLKLALMSECDWLRDDIRLILNHADVQWIELYALDDMLCFQKTPPLIAVKDTQPVNEIISRRVRISRMISAERVRRIRGRFFRVHRQMIFANEKRYFYDYYLLAFGPRNFLASLNRDNTDKV